MRRSSTIRLALAATAALAAASMAPSWGGATQDSRFGAPVRVTPDNGGGYEPGIYADQNGDLFMTAHKENAELALSPDSRSATGTRSMSWTWYSTDGGKTWKDLPLGPDDARNHEFGDEGDMALDDANNLYFVDTEVGDVTFTSWHVGSQGSVTFRNNAPFVGTAQAVDDRPWITAHGNGHVLYFGNEGDKDSYPVGVQNAGPGAGPGRYTVYRSTDGGQTWDGRGITLKDSGWCRPAAASHSPYVYAVCGDDAGADDAVSAPGDPQHPRGTIYSYVSPDDGKTWYRYPITHYNARDSWFSWPTVQVAPNGTLWASYLDGITPKCTGGDPVDGYQCTPTGARFLVMRSTDHGRHWRVWDATPGSAAANWQYRYAWLAADGNSQTLGMAVYARPYNSKKKSSEQAAWKVYGAVFAAGHRPTLVSLDDRHPVTDPGISSPPGDFLMTTFDNVGRLHVAWTRITTTASTPVTTASVYRDIYTISQR